MSLAGCGREILYRLLYFYLMFLENGYNKLNKVFLLMIDRVVKALSKRLKYAQNYFAFKKYKPKVEDEFAKLRAQIGPEDECLIVGNGPSVKNTDFSKYQHCKIFTMNRAYVKWEELGIKPFAHICVNGLVLDAFGEDLKSLECPTFINFVALEPEQFKPALFPLLMGFFIGDRVAEEITAPFSSGGTVTFVSLNIAMLLGFKKITIVGVDHSFTDKGPANKTVTMEGRDSNHFFDSYFPKGMRWELPDLERSEKSYQVIERYAKEKGISIVDETVGGKLRVFEKR